MPVPQLTPYDHFPDLKTSPDPDPEIPGLIATSRDISANQLLDAYSHGVFPWYSEGQPILWWSPNPRMVLYPEEFHVTKSLRNTMRKVLEDPRFEIRVDYDFYSTIRGCATQPRHGQSGTWITHAIMNSYGQLHERGYVHSIESYFNNELVAGLYCVNLGRVVFGESMFTKIPDASKLALATLTSWAIKNQIRFIDCQQETAHLTSLGGRAISRDLFLEDLETYTKAASPIWQFDKFELTHWLTIHEQS